MPRVPDRRERSGTHVRRASSRRVLAAGPAYWPGADALPGQHPLGHGDLLRLTGQVRRGSILAAAVGEPGLLSKLQASVEAVAGVRAPVSAGLARCDGGPVRPARGS